LLLKKLQDLWNPVLLLVSIWVWVWSCMGLNLRGFCFLYPIITNYTLFKNKKTKIPFLVYYMLLLPLLPQSLSPLPPPPTPPFSSCTAYFRGWKRREKKNILENLFESNHLQNFVLESSSYPEKLFWVSYRFRKICFWKFYYKKFVPKRISCILKNLLENQVLKILES